MWTIWVCPDCACTNVHAETCGAFPGEPVVHGNRVQVVPRAALRDLYDAGQSLVGYMPPMDAAAVVRWDDAMGTASDLLGREEAERCLRCGGAVVDPARHGEGWCVDAR